MGKTEHQVTLITRKDCHLCLDASAQLQALAAELGFGYGERDVDTDVDLDPSTRAYYSDRVPVILIDGAEHAHFRVDEAQFRQALAT